MKKRHIIYFCLLILLAQSFFIPFLKPVLPVIQLPGEALGLRGVGFFGNLGFTNTLLASLVTFVIILLIAFGLRAGSRTADEVPTGIYNFFEMIIEMAYNYVEDASGKWARTFFPFFMTFILWIVIANWMELVPGVDSIGKWETMGELRGHQAEAAAKADGITDKDELHHIYEVAEKAALEANEGDMRLNGVLLVHRGVADENAAEETRYFHGADKLVGRNPNAADWTIVPYIRAAATDLNFTIAVALISVIMTQYYGMKAQGMRYWSKFFTWDGDAIKENPLAVMNTGVGLLEFISEVFKIVSFAFRLLGNIFAGQVLLFVIGSLVPVANLLFWFLEFGIGLLQGVVFALLTLTFMKGATEEVHH